jgi:hypothetical protein
MAASTPPCASRKVRTASVPSRSRKEASCAFAGRQTSIHQHIPVTERLACHGTDNHGNHAALAALNRTNNAHRRYRYHSHAPPRS